MKSETFYLPIIIDQEKEKDDNEEGGKDKYQYPVSKNYRKDVTPQSINIGSIQFEKCNFLSA